MRLTLIVIMLFGIGMTLDSINRKLVNVQDQLTLTNCLTEAKLGQRCPEVDK